MLIFKKIKLPMMIQATTIMLAVLRFLKCISISMGLRWKMHIEFVYTFRLNLKEDHSHHVKQILKFVLAPCIINQNQLYIQYNIFLEENRHLIYCKVRQMFLQKIRKDNYLSQISRTQRNFRNKRQKKVVKKPLDPKEAEDNPVYRVLKRQKDTDAILNYIIDNADFKKPKRVSVNYPRSKTVLFETYNRKNEEQSNGRSKSFKRVLSFQEKAFEIVSDSRKVFHDLDKSKKRIKILDRFNKKIGKYCSYLPDNPEETRNQSNIANQQLRVLCNQDFFPSDNLYKRALSLMQYREPKIPLKKFNILKSKFITRQQTAAISSNTQPIQRLQTVQF